MNAFYRLISYIFISIFILLGLFLSVIVFFEAGFQDIYPTNDFKDAGPFGDYIGGVIGTLFSIAGIFLLFLNFLEQRKTFERERLETHFNERVNIYREHLNELTFSKKKVVDKTFWEHIFQKDQKFETSKYNGRKVFKVLYYQFTQLYDELDFFFNTSIDHIYTKEYKDWIEKNPLTKERNLDLIEYSKIDITYCIIFTGLASEDRLTLLEIFKKRYRKEFTTRLLVYCALKPVEHSLMHSYWKKLIAKDILRSGHFDSLYIGTNKNLVLTKDGHFRFFIELLKSVNLSSEKNQHKNYYKFYGGHQFRLGHYFRHLFNTVNYIDNRRELKYKEKKNYIINIRAQLSTYEQIILFLNSLSTYGRVWEYEDESEKVFVKFQKQLITKYNLIRNISTVKIAESIDVFKYYPNVIFETRYTEKDKTKRKKLENKYK